MARKYQSQGSTDITILSLNGLELYNNRTHLRSDESIYMHTQLPNDIYILRITGKDNIQTQKFIITR